MGEFLGALGLAWPRLLLYPGGVGAFLAAWLLDRWLRHQRRDKAAWRPLPSVELNEIGDLLPPLLVLTLLPLAPARSFPYGIDLMTALALLEWPRLRRLALSGGLEAASLRGLLPGYWLLLLATLALIEGAGGIELVRLLRAPATTLSWALLLGGGVGWLVALRRLLDLGRASWGMQLRALGHLLVAALPLLALLAARLADLLPAAWGSWLLPPLAVVGAALLLGAVLRLPNARWWLEWAIAVALCLLLAARVLLALPR